MISCCQSFRHSSLTVSNPAGSGTGLPAEKRRTFPGHNGCQEITPVRQKRNGSPVWTPARNAIPGQPTGPIPASPPSRRHANKATDRPHKGRVPWQTGHHRPESDGRNGWISPRSVQAPACLMRWKNGSMPEQEQLTSKTWYFLPSSSITADSLSASATSRRQLYASTSVVNRIPDLANLF